MTDAVKTAALAYLASLELVRQLPHESQLRRLKEDEARLRKVCEEDRQLDLTQRCRELGWQGDERGRCLRCNAAYIEPCGDEGTKQARDEMAKNAAEAGEAYGRRLDRYLRNCHDDGRPVKMDREI